MWVLDKSHRERPSAQQNLAEACRLCGGGCKARTAYRMAFAECLCCGFIFRRKFDRQRQANGMGMKAGAGGGYREYFLTRILTNDLGLGANPLLLYGTGNTQTLETLLNEGVDVVGSDLSKELVEDRRKRFGHDRFFYPHELPAGRPFDGFIFLLFLWLFFFQRFIIAFFRVDPAPLLGPFSQMHLQSAIAMGAATAVILWNWPPGHLLALRRDAA